MESHRRLGATVPRDHFAAAVHHGKYPSKDTGVIDVTCPATISAVFVIGFGILIVKRALKIRFRSEQTSAAISSLAASPLAAGGAAAVIGTELAWACGVVMAGASIAWGIHAERKERSKISDPELRAMLISETKKSNDETIAVIRELLGTRESIARIDAYPWLRGQPKVVSITSVATIKVTARTSAVLVRPQVAFPASATIITSEQLALNGKRLASKILDFLESRERSHLVVLREGGGQRPDEKRIQRAKRIEDAAIVEFQNKWQLEAERYLRHVDYPNVSGQIECRPISSFSDIKKMADQISTGAEMFADRANLVTLQKENNADE